MMETLNCTDKSPMLTESLGSSVCQQYVGTALKKLMQLHNYIQILILAKLIVMLVCLRQNVREPIATNFTFAAISNIRKVL